MRSYTILVSITLFGVLSHLITMHLSILYPDPEESVDVKVSISKLIPGIDSLLEIYLWNKIKDE